MNMSSPMCPNYTSSQTVVSYLTAISSSPSPPPLDIWMSWYGRCYRNVGINLTFLWLPRHNILPWQLGWLYATHIVKHYKWRTLLCLLWQWGQAKCRDRESRDVLSHEDIYIQMLLFATESGFFPLAMYFINFQVHSWQRQTDTLELSYCDGDLASASSAHRRRKANSLTQQKVT